MKQHLRKVNLILLPLVGSFLISCSSSKKEDTPADKEMAEVNKEAITVQVVDKSKEKPHWGYDGLFGPSLWGNLDPSYKACKSGQAQSPIDLIFKRPTSVERVEINYAKGPLAIADTGHSILVTGTKGSTLSVGGELYNLVQIHFHTPSEHTISGTTYDGEIHLLHSDRAGRVLVVAAMVNEGASNKLIDSIVKNVPTAKKQVKKAGIDFNPIEFLPKIKTHYSYSGSLTTPPCTEGVKWVVFNTPVTMSKEQLASLRAYYPNNNRPVQAINGRTVINY